MPRRALVPHEGEGCNERAAVPGWSLGRWSSASAPRKRQESRPIGRFPTGTVPAVPLKPSCVNNYKGRRGGRAAGGRRAARRRGARARAHPADVAHRRRFGLIISPNDLPSCTCINDAKPQVKLQDLLCPPIEERLITALPPAHCRRHTANTSNSSTLVRPRPSSIHCPGQAIAGVIAGAQRGGGSLGQGAMCPFTRGQLARSQEPYFQSQILLVSVSTRKRGPLKT